MIYWTTICHCYLELPCTIGPLGMESGAIPDSAITASSAHDSSHRAVKVRPNSGELNGKVP